MDISKEMQKDVAKFEEMMVNGMTEMVNGVWDTTAEAITSMGHVPATVIFACSDSGGVIEIEGKNANERSEEAQRIAIDLGKKGKQLHFAIFTAEAWYNKVKTPKDFDKWTPEAKEAWQNQQELPSVQKANECLVVQGMALNKANVFRFATIDRKGKKVTLTPIKDTSHKDGLSENNILTDFFTAYAHAFQLHQGGKLETWRQEAIDKGLIVEETGEDL